MTTRLQAATCGGIAVVSVVARRDDFVGQVSNLTPIVS